MEKQANLYYESVLIGRITRLMRAYFRPYQDNDAVRNQYEQYLAVINLTNKQYPDIVQKRNEFLVYASSVLQNRELGINEQGALILTYSNYIYDEIYKYLLDVIDNSYEEIDSADDILKLL